MEPDTGSVPIACTMDRARIQGASFPNTSPRSSGSPSPRAASYRIRTFPRSRDEMYPGPDGRGTLRRGTPSSPVSGSTLPLYSLTRLPSADVL